MDLLRKPHLAVRIVIFPRSHSNGLHTDNIRTVTIGSLDMPEYEVMRSPMSSQRVALFGDILDLSRLCEFLDEIYRNGSVAG
jgi:hypothetical protein